MPNSFPDIGGRVFYSIETFEKCGAKNYFIFFGNSENIQIEKKPGNNKK
ncbi:MAG TPA: hypothetical protein VLQ91_12225 [Draconibacterium sp.]|nr:hypothetical protein [Draconibacterium sp.]